MLFINSIDINGKEIDDEKCGDRLSESRKVKRIKVCVREIFSRRNNGR